MSRLPVRDLAAQEVADLVALLESRARYAANLGDGLGPALGASYAIEAGVTSAILGDLEGILRRRPLAE